MKKSILLLAAVLPLAFAACSDEQYVDQARGVVGNDGLGTLIDAPMINGSVSETDTRVYGKDGDAVKWMWKPTVTTDGDNETVTATEAIGLCWTGVGTDEYPGPLSATQTGDNVYTNNKFEHAGWLTEGDAPVIECNVLKNGAYHNMFPELTPQAAYANGSWTINNTPLDMSKGLFKSASATMYSGEYIVYSPYNEGFWNAPVTAVQPREMTLTVGTGDAIDPYELMSKYAFTVGYIKELKGGDEMNRFATRLVSSGLHLSFTGSKTIKEIVIWTKGEQKILLKQQISAKAVKEGRTGTNLYLDGNEAVASMVVKLGSAGLNVDGKDFYIPILPTKEAIESLNILLVDGGGLTADIVLNRPNLSGGPIKISRTISNDNVYKSGSVLDCSFESVNYAYDNDSFWAAYMRAKTNTSNNSLTQDARTVYMLDDITLNENNKDVHYSAKKEDDIPNIATSGIFVASAESDTKTLTLAGNEIENNVSNGILKYCFQNTTFGVNIETQAKGCCNYGKINLSLRQCAIDGTLTMNGGTLFLGGEVAMNGVVKSQWESNDVIGDGDLRPSVLLSQEAVVNINNDFLNEGYLLVQKKKTIEGADIEGHSTLNINRGTFTNAVRGEGEIISRASIEVQGNGEQDGTDGVVMIAGTATIENNADIENMGNITTLKGGEFNNNAGATFTDYVGSTLAGEGIKNTDETAEFICEVNSVTRYNAATDLNGIRPTTTLRFVYGTAKNLGSGSFTTEYTLKPNKESGIYVPQDGTRDRLIKFESAIDNRTASTNTLILNNSVNDSGDPVETRIGSLTINSGQVRINHEALVIEKDYTANIGALNTYLPVGIKEIGGNMNLSTSNEGTGNVVLAAGKTLNVKGNVNVVDVAGRVEFQKNSVVNVAGDINIIGVKGTEDPTGVSFGVGSVASAANMTIATDQLVTFNKNNVTSLGYKDVAGVLTNNGTVNIVNAVSGSDVAAIVWCNNFTMNGEYLNNSYPHYWK